MTATEESNVIRIPVSRTGGSDGSVSVSYNIQADTATLDSDYSVDESVTLSWEEGDSDDKYIEVTILNDAAFEQSDTMVVTLHSPTSGALGSIRDLVLTITGPNDVSPGSIQFQADCFPDCSSREYIAAEGAVVNVIVERVGGSDGSASVEYKTVDGTARNGFDYTSVSGSLSWESGDASTRMFQVLLSQDVAMEGEETIQLELSNAIGSRLSESHASKSIITIKASNGKQGTIQFAIDPKVGIPETPTGKYLLDEYNSLFSGVISLPRTVKEDDEFLDVIIRRAQGYDGTASVIIQTIDKTAIAGIHYTALTPTLLEWNDGDKDDKVVRILILDNSDFSWRDVSFLVSISNQQGAELGPFHTQEIVIQGPTDAARVSSFALDLNAGTLTLTTSMKVIAASFQPSKLTIESGGGQSYRLTSATTTSSADGTEIVLDLGSTDLNALKQAEGDIDTTFLTSEASLFEYIPQDCLAAATLGCAHPEFVATSSLQATGFVADTTSPTLVSFTLDLRFGYLKLHFSEPVERTSLDVTQIRLHDNNVGTREYSLTTESILFIPTPDPFAGVLYKDGGGMPTGGTAITILLGATDLAGLAAVGDGNLGVLRDNTFISLTVDSITDTAAVANPVVAVPSNTPLQVAVSDCSACSTGFFTSSSCTDTADRVCTACTVCGDDEFAQSACTNERDTVCYRKWVESAYMALLTESLACTECKWEHYASQACTPTQNRICTKCTRCTLDEYQLLDCTTEQNRLCLTCDSCSLTQGQEKQCSHSAKWRRRRMRSPYGCPTGTQTFQTREARLIALKSNKCGSGRCSCKGGAAGNSNKDGDNYPNDIRCTGPETYDIIM